MSVKQIKREKVTFLLFHRRLQSETIPPEKQRIPQMK